MAKKPQDGAQGEGSGRLKQIRMVASLVHKANPKAMPTVFAAAIGNEGFMLHGPKLEPLRAAVREIQALA